MQLEPVRMLDSKTQKAVNAVRELKRFERILRKGPVSSLKEALCLNHGVTQNTSSVPYTQ